MSVPPATALLDMHRRAETSDSKLTPADLATGHELAELAESLVPDLELTIDLLADPLLAPSADRLQSIRVANDREATIMIVLRLVLASVLAATTAVATAIPASADPADGPNASVASNVVCENGQVFETLIGTGVAGHLPSGPAVGVVKSLYVLLERGGDPVFMVFDRPGKGLNDRVVWCEWFNETDGFLLGGELLLIGRP